ncbi:Elongator subunit elp2, partial [Coemansia nantahalensis]
MAAACPELIAAACGRTAHALDWLAGGPIAFGAGTLVAVYDPDDPGQRGICVALRGHAGRVNCVRYAQGAPLPVLVSGSADGTARVWTPTSAHRDVESWQCAAVLSGHTGSITALAAVWLPGAQSVLIVTGATDGTLCVFEHAADPQARAADCPAQEARLAPVQVIGIGARTALDVALAVLPANGSGEAAAVVLGTGNTDSRVHLYTRDLAGGSPFVKALELAGHEDWVTSLAFLS